MSSYVLLAAADRTGIPAEVPCPPAAPYFPSQEPMPVDQLVRQLCDTKQVRLQGLQRS